MLLLTKPNGEFRFIIDYRRLNQITIKDAYPQPTVEELLQRLGGHSWFTKLDLKCGYYQIPIQQSDKEKTAFVTQDGLYQFEVLPMGLMNAPATFQRTMNNIIGYNRWDYVLVYLDDILIFSNSFEEHLNHLSEILTVLSNHHFTLNPKMFHCTSVYRFSEPSHHKRFDCTKPRTYSSDLGHPTTENIGSGEQIHRENRMVPKVYSRVCTNCGAHSSRDEQDTEYERTICMGQRANRGGKSIETYLVQ